MSQTPDTGDAGPELGFETRAIHSGQPPDPSTGAVNVPVNQLRDPAIFEEDGRVYLLYAVAGERGIALAEVHLEP